MTAETPTSRASAEPNRTGGGFPGAVLAEWTKLWSVRSSWWCLGLMIVLTLPLAAFSGYGAHVQIANGTSEVDSAGAGGAPQIAVDAVFYVAQFTVIALATMFIAGEYANGSIRATLQWIPVRTRMLLAKVTALAPLLLVLGALLGGASIALAGMLLSPYGPPLTFGSATVTALSIGCYLALLGVMAVGVGVALRSVAGTLTVMVLMLLISPLVASMVGVPGLIDALPGVAGVSGMLGPDIPNPLTRSLPPYGRLAGLGILAAWAVAALLLGNTVLRKRDA